MPKFAANLSMMFTELSFLERFAAAASCGFTAVEYLFPYEYPADVLAEQLHANKLQQALFNLPPGDWSAGERGIACLPGREIEFLAGVQQAIAYAKVLGNTRVHAMAGLAPASISADTLETTYKTNMAKAARLLAPHGLTLCLEPINQRSMPGYFLRLQEQAVRLIEDMDEPNIRLQFDMFHVQMEEGCVALKLRQYFKHIGHIQIASVPDRHEPDTGELNYSYLFSLLGQLQYDGFVGCEYNPAADTATGLGWFAHAQKNPHFTHLCYA